MGGQAVQQRALTIKLTGVLEAPMLLYLSMPAPAERTAPGPDHALASTWQALVERLAGK
ncbi:hypothetical protein ACIQMV_32310 [Streptomyces sp. NPDC091412]|uniref:hypothetical protein n=1 Tax=Streptomyces sp. NPDC091412 TaxID=3366002 RepID=UPI0037F4E46E